MDELTIRFAFMLVGLAVGLVLGWTSRAAHDAHQIREQFVDENQPARRFRLTRSDLLLGVLVVIALVSSVSTWQVNARIERVAECTTQVTEDLVEAANERTNYSAESTRRNVELLRVQEDFLNLQLDPESERSERREALAAYAEAVRDYTQVQRRAAAQRRQFPYPSTDEIERCKE